MPVTDATRTHATVRMKGIGQVTPWGPSVTKSGHSAVIYDYRTPRTQTRTKRGYSGRMQRTRNTKTEFRCRTLADTRPPAPTPGCKSRRRQASCMNIDHGERQGAHHSRGNTSSIETTGIMEGRGKNRIHPVYFSTGQGTPSRVNFISGETALNIRAGTRSPVPTAVLPEVKRLSPHFLPYGTIRLSMPPPYPFWCFIG